LNIEDIPHTRHNVEHLRYSIHTTITDYIYKNRANNIELNKC